MIDNFRRGSALLIVLLVMGLFSLSSVLLVQYAQWQSNLNDVPRSTLASKEALRFGRDRVHQFLQDHLSDTGVLPSPTEKVWNLKPSMTVRARIVSLNAKLNLNALLSDTYAGDARFLEPMLKELGYPRRTYDELRNWVNPDTKSADATYAGYGYHAPGRKIYHLDEVHLISGIIQKGVSSSFRRLFTVYGSGKFNLLHLTPEKWELLSSTGGLNLPSLPPEARRSQDNFRDFLRQDRVWETLKNDYPFLTRRDDSIQVDYMIKAGSYTRNIRAIYEYNHLNNALKLETRYPLFESFSEDKMSDLTKL